jgi:hypothetical protein
MPSVLTPSTPKQESKLFMQNADLVCFELVLPPADRELDIKSRLSQFT